MDTRLYVGNLSHTTTEQALRDLFMQAGNVASVTMIKDAGTNRSKGFAFVEMTLPDEAKKAIILFNGQTLGERALTVSVARPREPRQSFGAKQDVRSNNRRRF